MENAGKNRAQEAIRFEKKMLERIMQYLTSEELEHAQFDHRIEGTLLRFDLYLERGSAALGWPEKTAIEIKYELMPDTLFKMLTMPTLLDTLHNPNLLNRLVILYKEVDPSVDKPIESKIPGRLEIYTELKFSRYIKQRESEGYLTIVKPSKQDYRLVEIIEEKSPYVKEQEQLIQSAQSAFRNERVSIFLGAGVSVDAGLPNWQRLLEGMLKQENSKPFQHISEQYSDPIMKACANSSIVVGRYTFNGYGDTKRFTSRIKRELYRRKHYSFLVDTLCQAIVSSVGREHIMHIITYNYDDLIEQRLDEMQYHEHYSVYGKNRDATKRLPIYHVHGMIPQRELISSTPILSEKDYHELYKNNHNWANVVQLYSMNNTTCFFIGLSMTDPNLRRLLDFSRSNEGISHTDKEELPHYAFLRKEALKEDAPQAVNEEHWNEMETMMQEFGINIIWYNDFIELPDLIRRIML